LENQEEKEENTKLLLKMLKKEIIPLKKGEIIKGSKPTICHICNGKKWSCKCHRIKSRQ
jgi:hypothetical protein